MDYESMEYFEPAEHLVKILQAKNQSTEGLFFRVMVAYYFSKVSSIMRTNIVTLDRGSIPTNVYALNLGVSGLGKGKSVNIIEEQILSGFKKHFMDITLPKIADKNISKLAIERARKDKSDPDEMYEKIQREYASTGAYYFNFDSGTAPAVKQLRHQLLLAGAGAINLEMDEVGANFSNNIEILNTFIELYDVGKVKPKITKSTVENQRHESIEGNTPANLLLFGTPTKLLDGGKAEADFYSMLDMGYARRLLFSYVSTIKRVKGLTPTEILDKVTDTSTDLYINTLHDLLEELADAKFFNKDIIVNREVTLELIKYEQDCIKRADALKDHQEMEKAEISHRYFRALKLAGTYTFLDKSTEMTIKHLHAAIKLVEDSGQAFKKILTREKSYVKLAKYIANVNGEVTHVDLVEDLPFYKGSESAKRDLLNLAIAYGYKNNIIIKKTFVGDIEFLRGESLPTTDLSSLIASASKHVAYDYVNDIISFEQLAKFTQQPDIHFTVHHWLDGHRVDKNAILDFNLIVLDIDEGVSMDIARKLLGDYKYIMYTTKRHTPAKNRYRIILPMSHTIRLEPEEFAKFMENVFEWLPFDVDTSAKDIARKWLTNPGELHTNDGKLIDAMLFIPETKKSEEMNRQRQSVSSMSNMEAWFYRSIGTGNRNNLMLQYGLMLLDSGYTVDAVRSSLLNFNSKLADKLEETEIHSTIMMTIAKKAATTD